MSTELATGYRSVHRAAHAHGWVWTGCAGGRIYRLPGTRNILQVTYGGDGQILWADGVIDQDVCRFDGSAKLAEILRFVTDSKARITPRVVR